MTAYLLADTVKVTTTGSLPVLTTPASSPTSSGVDAFGRLRVSTPNTLFDTVHQYDYSPLFWDKISVHDGSISHVPSKSGVLLTVQSGSSDSITFQTHNYLRYSPGKSHLVLMTGLLGGNTTNVIRRAGYFDDANGVFFEVTGDDNAVVRRTSTSGVAVDNRIPQSSWNVDTLDGTGNASNPSGILLDVTKMQLMVIDLQWLSIGIVRFGFEIDGVSRICHISKHANLLTVPYMSTANLPVRYQLANSGSVTGSNTLLAVCSTVASEGGASVAGLPGGVNTGTTVQGVTGAKVPLLSIRPSLTFQGFTNRGLVNLSQIDVFSDQGLMFEVWLNPTLTNASFSPVDSTNSIVDYDTAATVCSGGYRLMSFIGNGTKTVTQNDIDLSKKLLSLNASGSFSDIVTVTASKIATNANSVCAAMNWIEFR